MTDFGEQVAFSKFCSFPPQPLGNGTGAVFFGASSGFEMPTGFFKICSGQHIFLYTHWSSSFSSLWDGRCCFMPHLIPRSPTGRTQAILSGPHCLHRKPLGDSYICAYIYSRSWHIFFVRSGWFVLLTPVCHDQLLKSFLVAKHCAHYRVHRTPWDLIQNTLGSGRNMWVWLHCWM